MKFKISRWHGEHKTLFYVIDVEADEVVSSFDLIEQAENFIVTKILQSIGIKCDVVNNTITAKTAEQFSDWYKIFCTSVGINELSEQGYSISDCNFQTMTFTFQPMTFVGIEKLFEA